MKRTLAIGLLFLSGTASAQFVPQPLPVPPSTLCTDQLAITGFSVNPPAPQAEQEVTVTLSIKNQCATTLNVPWDISRNATFVSQGTVAIAPGAIVNVSGIWVATPGSHYFYASADINKTIYDSNRSNNITQNINLTVAPLKERQQLNFQKAKLAGATFATNSKCFDMNCRVNECGDRPCGPYTVVFVVQGNQGLGGRMDPEAFNSANGPWNLKNGWYVYKWDVAAPGIEKSTLGGSDWNWVTGPPQYGNKSPYLKMHMWADALGALSVFQVITIEGPKGTDPYNCMQNIDCNTGLPTQ